MTLTCDVCGADTAFELGPADFAAAAVYCSIECRAAAEAPDR